MPLSGSDHGDLRAAAREARAVLYQVMERLEMNNLEGEESPFIEDCQTALTMLNAALHDNLRDET
jgi:hypothetical protein